MMHTLAGEGFGRRRMLTVAELVTHIKSVLERDALLSGVLVRGEISNFRQPSSGHMYFTIKDEGSQIRCVMFRGQGHRLRFAPYDGLAVDIAGYVSVYERDGQCQLYVQDMKPAGIGDLYLAFERLKERLAAEGLFDVASKRRLPLLPARVAIVTSPTGAALRDVLTVASRRWPRLDVVVVPAQVQGDEAAPQLVPALEIAGTLPRVDVVILTRGGGSLEELWAFNEEIVARAIRACPRPVVVGVGHETDVTIADLAADVRAATPSAAAELVFPDAAAQKATVDGLVVRLRSGLRRQADGLRRRLERAASSPALRRPDQLLAQRAQRLDTLTQALSRGTRHSVERRHLRLQRLAGQLDALSPLAVLGRGYAICSEATTGEVIRSASQAAVGDQVRVHLGQGALACLVEGMWRDDPAPQCDLPQEGVGQK